MSDPELRAPPPRAPMKPNAAAVKHQRRPSFHSRRRSQHSIASFGDIADDVIKAPSLGSLGESTREDDGSEGLSDVGVIPHAKKSHGRKPSNVHQLFDEDEDSQEAMDNMVQALMAENDDIDGFSPRPIDLEDAPDYAADFAKMSDPEPKVPSAKARNQSFGGIVDLFGHSELESGISQNPEQEVQELREENSKLRAELEKSNRIRRQLEAEIRGLRESGSGSSFDEIERIKSSKISLILAAVSEIDRMRSIIISQERTGSGSWT